MKLEALESDLLVVDWVIYYWGGQSTTQNGSA